MLFAHQQHFQAFLKLHKTQRVEERALGWGGRLSQPLSDSSHLHRTVDGVYNAGSVLKPGGSGWGLGFGGEFFLLPNHTQSPLRPPRGVDGPRPALKLLPRSEDLNLRATHLASALWLDPGVGSGVAWGTERRRQPPAPEAAPGGQGQRGDPRGDPGWDRHGSFTGQPIYRSQSDVLHRVRQPSELGWLPSGRCGLNVILE